MQDIDLNAAMEVIEGDVEFIRIFMRFEFALKEKYGKLDWFALYKLLEEDFYDKIKEDRSACTLLSSPPHSQYNNNGNLDWKKTNPPENTTQLIKCVQKVRDNLLHGGKSEHPDKDRNVALINESRAVLLSALTRDNELRRYFERFY